MTDRCVCCGEIIPEGRLVCPSCDGGKKKVELKPCPFCKKKAVYITVHDDEGNYHGLPGCDYESNPWSGLSYALHHEGWGDCILCSDGDELVMGGVLFDTAEEAAEEWNRVVKDEQNVG